MASSIQTSGICISILDALRDEYFVGVYQMPDCKPLLSEARLPAKKVEALLRRYAKYQKPIFVCGASERFRSCLSARATVGAAFPVAADLLRWADHTLTQKAYPYERIQPIYLREASAVERRHKK
jgi:tRNA A37 threonylcarbamoyladenosine modification protein TsaB